MGILREFCGNSVGVLWRLCGNSVGIVCETLVGMLREFCELLSDYCVGGRAPAGKSDTGLKWVLQYGFVFVSAVCLFSVLFDAVWTQTLGVVFGIST